jgi:omega-amidase
MSSLASSAPLPTAALLQFHSSSDKAANIANAQQKIASAFANAPAGSNVKLVLLPEIWNSPYATNAFPDYAEELPSLSSPLNMRDSPSAAMLSASARQHNAYIVGGSVSERSGSSIYNTCMVFDPTGALVAKHRKVHLFDINVPGGICFKESDTLSPGNTLLSTFDTGSSLFGVVGLGICYDIRFPELALLLRKKHDVSVICYPGAFNMTTGPAHWELLQRARAVDAQCYVLTASPARATAEMLKAAKDGKYAPYSAWGHSTGVNPWGEVVATTDEKESTVYVDVDLDKVKSMKTGIPTSEQKRTDLYKVDEV